MFFPHLITSRLNMNSLKQQYYDGDANLFLHQNSKLLFDKLKKKVKEKDIKKFLKQQRSYTLYKQSTAKDERNPYKVYYIDQVKNVLFCFCNKCSFQICFVALGT